MYTASRSSLRSVTCNSTAKNAGFTLDEYHGLVAGDNAADEPRRTERKVKLFRWRFERYHYMCDDLSSGSLHGSSPEHPALHVLSRGRSPLVSRVLASVLSLRYCILRVDKTSRSRTDCLRYPRSTSGYGSTMSSTGVDGTRLVPRRP